jgi:hypothetical protein
MSAIHATELARTIRPGERRDNGIALFHTSDVLPDSLDNADEPVPHATSGRRRLHLLVGPESLPQIHARVTRTTASVGRRIRGSGTVSTRTSPAPYMTVACIVKMSRPLTIRLVSYEIFRLDGLSGARTISTPSITLERAPRTSRQPSLHRPSGSRCR